MIFCKFLSDEERQILIDFFDRYREPFCFVFAIACARGMDVELVLLKEKGHILHAGVRDKEGFFRDVRGKLDLSGFSSGFAQGSEFSTHVSSEEEMKNISLEMNGKPLPEALLERARIHAESIWPEWEWEDSQLKRVQAFTQELSTLCEKYGVWIREMFPSTPPVICQAEGDEQFELEQLCSPNRQYLLRRVIG